jgi:TolB-like protein/tRNA A-37 threonylcarbamoyl transferase component Bud32/Flp pilus assembly protein TadD
VIGRNLAHYRITAALGAGGMGEVWRATDTKLGREVALKVLPAEMAESAERLDRFRREAMTLASLDHPGVVGVYSVEESDGVHFLTMQLVEGKSLDRIVPEGGMPLEQLLEIASALTEALAAAHDKGIIHRDLKPANVMVTKEGRVKVLDFGLAKITGPQSDEPLNSEMATDLHTREGVVMGTVPYMSPEQLSGRQVDQRSDIFSLGVILYEMASGERPYQGRSSVELASAILRDTPRPIGELRRDLPLGLVDVIGSCLEKSAADRWQSARDIRERLRGAGASTPAVQAKTAADPGDSLSDEGFWVAVRPFKVGGDDPDLDALADGISDEIVTGLSRFSYLRVVARGSGVRDPRYLIEGSIRKAGTKLRLAVHLVDVTTGTHLWAETYERGFNPEAVFELQDDLVPRIVSTVADMNGVLPRSMGEALRNRPPDQLSPYQAVLRSFAYFSRLTAEELAAARSGLELAVKKAPAYTDAWAMLALLCAQEYGQDFNLLPDALAVGADAARRAVETGSSNHLAHFSLAQVLFFKKEFGAFRNAAERAAALNPMDGNSIAFLGELLTYAGDVERGLELAERAKQLNPHHPGWYWMPDFYHAYSQGDYSAALAVTLKMNLPGHIGMHMFEAACGGQLGRRETAAKALRSVLELRPDFADVARSIFVKWWNPDHVEHLIDGLRKAGLEMESGEVAENGGTAPSPPSTQTPIDPGASTDRTSATPQEGSAESKSIVVLPFANLSPDPDTEYFSDGLTDEIITDLSRVRALRVISRSSAMRLKGDARGLAAIGRDLACRYVLEGSVRRAANNLRITARLVDAPDDIQLWAEKYAGALDDVFDIQERVSRSIVDALEIQLTPHEAAQLAERPIDDVRAQESYLRARNEIWSFLPSGVDLAISHLQAALEMVGDNALIYQGLGEAYFQYVNIGAAIGREEELIRKAEDCVDKIFGLEPESPRGYLVRAETQMARGDIHGGVRSLRRVLQVYPNEIVALQLYTHAHGWLGGKPEVAGPTAARLVDLDPLNPMSLLVWAMVPLFAGRFQEGVAAARRMFELDPVTPVWRANYVMALSYAGRIDEAETLTEEVAAEPDSDVGTWWMGLWRAAWREDRAEVLRLADGPYRQAADWDAEIPWVLASAHAAVGATEEALHWLDKAIDQGMINHPFLAEHDRFLDNIRGDQRFGRTMERAKREWKRLDEMKP